MEVFYTDLSKAVGFNYKNKKKPFYLLNPIFFIVQYAKNKRIRAKIDQGFESDGTTVPHLFMWLIGCRHTPEYLNASIIHDWIINHPEIVNYNRKFSSKIFKTVLLQDGVPRWKAHLMYLGVEFGQWYRNFTTKRWRV